jgi:protein-L-isoaspartate(D-aspartate) O-methyltransferase
MAEQSRITGIVLVVILGVVFVGGVVVVALVKPDIFRPATVAPVEPVSPLLPASSEPDSPAEPAPAAPEAVVASPEAPAYDITARTSHPPLRDKEAFVRWSLDTYFDDEKLARARFDRAQEALAREDIRNDRVLEAFLRTPRHEFSRPRNIVAAYDDTVLSLGYGQTMSGPHLQSRMTSFLDPQPEHRVLEIGTGSGVQAAFLAQLSDYVYTIEIVPQLAAETDLIYSELYGRYPEYQNIKRKEDDGYYGWPEHAPFDRIIVTCGIDHIPPDLLKQLKVDGIMVIPVGPPGGQTVMKITKTLDGSGNIVLEREDIYAGKRKVMFVPFTAKGGGVHSSGGESP